MIAQGYLFFVGVCGFFPLDLDWEKLPPVFVVDVVVLVLVRRPHVFFVFWPMGFPAILAAIRCATSSAVAAVIYIG